MYYEKEHQKITYDGLTAVLGAGLLAGCGGDGKIIRWKQRRKSGTGNGVWIQISSRLWKKWLKPTTRNT